MAYSRRKPSGNINLRIYILMFLVFFASGIIVLQLFSLQVVKHNIYYAIANEQYQFTEKLSPDRGKIYVNDLASGGIHLVAVNEERYLVYAAPKNIDNADEAADKISKIVNIPKNEISGKLADKSSSYEVIKHGVSAKEIENIEKLKLAGIKYLAESVRYYPDGVFASHVLGFVGYGEDNKRSGKYGVENYYNKELEGKTGYIETELDGRGKLIPTAQSDSKPSNDGADIVLTIDQTIQFLAEKKIKETVDVLKGESGTIIVMDPKKGSILAMANYPAFNPNEYGKVDNYEKFINSAVQKRYEPGSVIKPFTMAVALDTGKISPDTTYEDKGFVTVDDRVVHNFDNIGRGITTMTEVLEQSLNTGAVFAQSRVDKNVFLSYFKDFGFNLPTGIDLAGEAGGDITNLEKNKNSDIAYATASFGQGIALTPIELLTAVSAIANEGKMMKPYLAEKIIDANGKITAINPAEIRQVVSAKTAARLSAMLVSVTKSKYYQKAYLPGYNIAAKTGTAQIANKDKQGYSEERIHTFVGFGPVPSPKFSILIKVDKPQNEIYASNSLSPVFKEMVKFLLDYYHIEPVNN